MPPQSLLLLLVAVSSAAGATAAATAAKCHPDDEAGLLGFKSGITSDPSGMLAKWAPGTDCCTWPGVGCGGDLNRVSDLSLYGQDDAPNSTLSGTISPSLSRLTHLSGIYLIRLRHLSGPFPPALLRLPSLSFIYIEESLLSGPLPKTIPSSISALSLAGNRFTGPIPASITALSGLTQLILSRNLLSGEVPAALSRLYDLTVLRLDGNRLTGGIPDLSKLSNLRRLSLSGNRLTGSIPSTLAPLSKTLAFLELGHNSLTGEIPEFIGNFTALDTLDLAGNALTGSVPTSFKNLTKIFNLDLSKNYLTDPFPAMQVKGIESLDLSYNRFNLGEIPSWASSSPIIYSLKLAGCGIRMRLDDWKPSETYYYDYIDLSDNEISGGPAGLLNRTEYLIGFWAAGNKMRFELKEVRLGKRMQYLDVSRNLAFGEVPPGIAGLKEVNLSYNHLCGRLPATRFPATAFAGNDCLCGKPLPACRS